MGGLQRGFQNAIRDIVFNPSNKEGRGETGGARARKGIRGTDPVCLHDVVFLIIKVTDNDFRELGKSVRVRHGGEISQEPTRRQRVCLGVMLGVDNPCVLVTKHRVVRMSLS